MGILFQVRRILRLCWHVTFLVFLISLPVTFFPILAGIEGAWTFHFWARAQVQRNLNALEFEAESHGRLNYFNVPGAIGIHEFMEQKGPFHVPKLSSITWLEKLGLTKPNEHLLESAGADKLGSLDGLVRDMSCYAHSVEPTRYWVYVASGAQWLKTEWDEAFDEILQQNYVKPLPSNYTITYLDCASTAFLCGIWSVRAPSLLSFTVEKESLSEQRARQAEEAASDDEEQSTWIGGLLDIDYTYDSPPEDLYPVTVRVIELPLDDDQALLPRTTLPTPALQLRALLLDPDPDSLLEHWYPHHVVVQTMHRFNELADTLSERVGTWRYYLNECDKWYTRTVVRPIFGKQFSGSNGFSSDVQNVVFSIGVIVGEVIHFPFNCAWNIYAWYFGLGWDGQPIEHMSTEDDTSMGTGSFMDDLFAGALGAFMQNLSAQASESAGKAAVTER